MSRVSLDAIFFIVWLSQHRESPVYLWGPEKMARPENSSKNDTLCEGWYISD